MAFEILDFDRKLIGAVALVLSNEVRSDAKSTVQFQFPPIVKADSKAAKFEEKDARNIEPVAIFMGAGARTIDFKWSYIVTGGEWNIDRISGIVKRVRGFFYASAQEAISGVQNGANAAIIIRFHAYDVVGSTQAKADATSMSFRADGIDVSHSDVVVGSNGLYYPLRTDLSMKLKLWTTGVVKDNSGKETAIVKLRGMSDPSILLNSAPLWY